MDEAPGWDAIEQAVREHARPEGEPLHWSTSLPPGELGVVGVSAYPTAGTWLLVTFGMSELHDKVSEDLERSGYGFELTMRVPRPSGDDGPPRWALTLLDRLGTYVFDHAKPFGPGHRMDPGGPITGAEGTRLTAVAFTDDVRLPATTTPNGSLAFLQVVGVTDDELERMQASTTAAVLAELAAASPDLVTDPSR